MSRIQASVLRKLTRTSKRADQQLEKRVTRARSFYMRFDASFRIGGAGAYHEEITEITGISPSSSHKVGEYRSRYSKKPWAEDIWILSSPKSETCTLDEHLAWLWSQIQPHEAYFLQLIEKSTWADICLGCLSQSPYPVLSLEKESTNIIKALNLSLAFNFTCV